MSPQKPDSPQRFDFKAYFTPERLKALSKGLWREVAFAVIILFVGFALFGRTADQNSKVAGVRVATQGFPNALEVDVMNVDPVIARHFKLGGVRGVLVSDAPQGTARRQAGLKRGDVIMSYNGIEVQSAHHLGHLMSQNRGGDTVRFDVVRGGRIQTLNVKVPAVTTLDNFTRPRAVSTIVMLLILLGTFGCLFFNVANRTVVVTLGAAASLLFGGVLGFYDQTQAFASVELGPILILVGMSIFSIALERFGFFEIAARKTILWTRGDAVHAVLSLVGFTYALSLVMNNLSTILVIVPLALSVARNLKIKPIPVISALIIASNIGGASTMIGDFPNMLISASTGLSFMEFIIFMGPIGLVLLGAMSWYLLKSSGRDLLANRKVALQTDLLRRLESEITRVEVDRRGIQNTLATLLCVVIAFIVLPAWRIGPATIALGGGFLLLAIERNHAREMIRRINFGDVLFFVSLFILVGGALHSGLLKGTSDLISALSGGQRYLYLLALLWTAGFFTAFLNAGPAAAFFVPVVMHSHFAGSSDLVWWALSLGILAGSSATLAGATAGVVSQSLMEGAPGSVPKPEERMSFARYSRFGVPVAVMFLVISSLYIVFLASIPGIV
ncbi:MAG: PDZ domain-containing protein [Candidatus Omnitrophica bacterium]|nr:PDZ domain-containing protein [Candidatus Omnitrophota bacterium]